MTSQLTRPIPLPVNVAGIPTVLTAQSRWDVWRYIWRDGRWTKMQFQPSGAGAKSNDTSTWVPWATALAAYESGRFDGVSFALGDGWAGIDIDHFRLQPHPEWASRFRALGAYAERSPGGDGIKLIGRATRIGGELKFGSDADPTRTTWSAPRFFTITGQDSLGNPLTDITDFIAETFPLSDRPSVTREGYTRAATRTDRELLFDMFRSKDGAKILALWRGQFAHGDHSRADLALCRRLAWWTNYDRERVARLFRASGLMRDHWNANSYQQATLGKALQ